LRGRLRVAHYGSIVTSPFLIRVHPRASAAKKFFAASSNSLRALCVSAVNLLRARRKI
jgi:hypothetical protein